MSLDYRLVKVLVLANKENFKFLESFIRELTTRLKLLQVDLYVKYDLNKFKTFINSQKDLYTLVIDLSFNDEKLEGFGPRYKNIFSYVDPELKIEEGVFSDDIDEWYSSTYDFSVLKIGTLRSAYLNIFEGILVYLNGK